RIQSVMSYFEERPLLMASQSANDLCLSLLIEEGEHEQLLKSAHAALIPADVGGADPVFGPSWRRIQPFADRVQSL
ncbi:MAG: hypothetical protein OET41_14845, partial [Xanthomonadales bacterium]|nr:hypothetical protein [Xanthomonadales bacterium]